MISPYAFPGIKVKDLPKILLEKLISKYPKHVTSTIIANAVEEAMGIPFQRFKGPSRTASLVQARTYYSHFNRKYLRTSLKELGRELNGRDHTTIVHNLIEFNKFYDTEPAYKNLADTIEFFIEKKSCVDPEILLSL